MDPVVTFLLETLRDEIVSTSRKLNGVRDQIEILRDDLNYYKSVLESRTRDPIERSDEKTLLKQLREAVYDAEDILAAFVAEETHYKGKTIIGKFKSSTDHASKLLTVAKKIKSMRDSVREMHERRNYANQDGPGATNGPKPRMVPSVEEENVVGFDGEAKTVIDLLTKGQEDLEVITIIGMPGLGKTTLAKMIYRDSKIEFEFYNRVWVYVSKDCNVREVFLQILGPFTKVTNEMHEMPIDKLGEEVKRNLEREKYLIVMDDVWEPKDWIALEKAFPKNKKNSRILITSRNENVAKHANPSRSPHKLKFLEPVESFELLNLKAFGSRNCPYKDLVTPGWQIAQECGGLPLALVVIGGFLREKGVESEQWTDVSKNVEAYINMDPENNLKKLIAWSFYELPYPLKACFLYFGMFPEDSQISARKLIRMWIAEGFIQQIGDISLEKIAEQYLEDLVKRNLVIVGDWSSYGKIKTCHIHDMIRAFCIEIATEENLYHEVKQFDPSTYTSSNLEFQKYRRICVHSRVLNYLNSKDSISPNIRSFSCSSTEEITLQTAQVSCIPKTYKLLRVFDGKPIAFPIFPRDLPQLVHLRYLVLSIKFKLLPDTLSNLWNLQSLIVHTTTRTLEIKGDSLKLLRLRHLETNASTSWLALSKGRDKKEPQLVRNENLTTLSTISPETCTKDAFDRVPKITKLGIRGQLAKILNGGDPYCSFEHLAKLKLVKTLKLHNDVLDVSDVEGEITRIPATGFPPTLKKLTLTNTQLDWLHMSTLGKLEKLEILKLKENAFKGKYWDSKPGEFRALKVLLVGRTDLVSWQTSGDHFPTLKRLSLHHCTYLNGVPLGLADFPGLQTVELFWTTTSAVSLAKNIHKQSQGKGKDFKLTIYPPDHEK